MKEILRAAEREEEITSVKVVREGKDPKISRSDSYGMDTTHTI